MKRFLLLGSALFLLLGGCEATRSDYVRPKLDLPDVWVSGEMGGAKNWVDAFHDPALSKLVAAALLKNNDLAAAALAVRKAELKADLAEDQFLPSWSASGSFSESQNLRGHPEVTRAHALSTTLSYEADLWGNVAAARDAATWEARATEQDRQTTAISLVGSVVSLYWKLAYLKERIALADDAIASTRKALAIVKTRHAAGADSALELAAAEESLASQESSLTQYVQQKVETENALAILFDAPPENKLVRNPPALTRFVPTLDAGAPATLLERRPDLRAAEMRLRESLASVDETRTSYLPTFTLTGTIGASSVALSDVLRNPIGTLGAGIALPFLNYFDMRKNVDISEVDYEKAVVSFRQTLYTALSDVENALSARKNDETKTLRLERAAKAASLKERLVAVRYKEGYVDLQTWLDAQDTKRTADVSLLENRYAEITDAVTLYKALGGDDAATAKKQ